EAALKGCGCVSANNHAHKNTGLSGIPAAKKHIFGRWKSPESPVFRPFFRRLFVFYICHQYHALNMRRGKGAIIAVYLL
ncbi:MAG: hypothetical protein ACOX7I_06985, partial [Oscillospiraceae bacterium]